MHELARSQTTFIPSLAPTPRLVLVRAPCVGFDKLAWSDKKFKKCPPQMLVWHLAKPLSSSCFARELAETLNNFLQVS